jgi:hypothetical protein
VVSHDREDVLIDVSFSARSTAAMSGGILRRLARPAPRDVEDLFGAVPIGAVDQQQTCRSERRWSASPDGECPVLIAP